MFTRLAGIAEYVPRAYWTDSSAPKCIASLQTVQWWSARQKVIAPHCGGERHGWITQLVMMASEREAVHSNISCPVEKIFNTEISNNTGKFYIEWKR